MSGVNAAIAATAKLNEIGFPEFTCKLITDVFDALISANLRQVAAYGELMSSVSKSLSQYINDTVDDISGVDVLAFLLKILPDDANGGTSIRRDNNAVISDDNRNALVGALKIQDGDNVIQDVSTAIPSGITYLKAFDAICNAAANRLAANKYDMLVQMVKMGFMRLVIESGTIETRLYFSTWGSDYVNNNASYYDTTSEHKVTVPGFLSLWGMNMGITDTKRLTVTMSGASSNQSSSTASTITGGVTINFKTDYIPLDRS